MNQFDRVAAYLSSLLMWKLSYSGIEDRNTVRSNSCAPAQNTLLPHL